MAELPFKYSILFPKAVTPKAVGSKGEDEDKNSFEVIHKSDIELEDQDLEVEAVEAAEANSESLLPVIVLLGWAGCQEKHLRKYASMYERKGYITVLLIVPLKTLFFQAYKMTDVARGLLDVLAEHGLTSNPVIFHLFSNGGSMVYSQLSSLVNRPDGEKHHRLSVRGVILDSAPGRRRILNAVKAFMATLQFGQVLRYALGFCLLLYLVFTRYLRQLLPGLLGMEKAFHLYDSMCMDPADCPQLFLFSKADQVILAEDVKDVIAARKEKGVQVKSLCWDDSQHVAHLRAHPEVYAKTCLDFAEACFAS